MTITSSTPNVIMQILTRIVAPIVALIGSIVAIIFTTIKIRQSLGKPRARADD